MLLLIEGVKQQSESSRGFVYRILRDNIMRLHLPPGLYLFEDIICEELGVSRTPVREAVFDLVEERLVDVFPKKRSLISLIDFTLVHEGIFLRSTVDSEVMALCCGAVDGYTVHRLKLNLEGQRLAAESADTGTFFRLEREFLRDIYASVHMEHIWDNVCSVCSHYERLRYFDEFVGGMCLNNILAGNTRLLDILAHDEKTALESHTHSLLSTFGNLQPYVLEQYRNYFHNLDCI